MTDKNIVYLYVHKAMYDIYFFGAIAVPFFVFKGHDTRTALLLMSVYIVSTLIFEVPTGIVSDKYGHKESLLVGVLTTGTGMLILLATGGVIIDIIGLLIMSVGGSLVSGSDVGLLKKISRNFSKDNRRFAYVKTIALMISFSAAGYIAAFDYRLTVFLGAIVAMLSGLPLFFITTDVKSEKRTFRAIVRESSHQLKKTPSSILIFTLIAVMGAYTASSKDIMASLESIIDLDIRTVGLLVASTMLFRTIGVYIEQHMKSSLRTDLLLLSILTLLSAIIVKNPLLGIMSFLTAIGLAEALFYRAKFQLADQTPHATIASVMSASNLTRSLAMAGYIALAGFLSNKSTLPFLFFTIGLVYIVLFAWTLVPRKKG